MCELAYGLLLGYEVWKVRCKIICKVVLPANTRTLMQEVEMLKERSSDIFVRSRGLF